MLSERIADAAVAVRQNQIALAEALRHRGEEFDQDKALLLLKRDQVLADELWRLVDKRIAQQKREAKRDQGVLV